MSRYFEKNPKPITYARACMEMSYEKALKIIAYWRRYDFYGRVKTNEVLAAEDCLKNPLVFLKKHGKELSNIYAELSKANFSIKAKR
jgi:hypothetical protein